MLLCDVTNLATYSIRSRWDDDLARVCGHKIPMAICGHTANVDAEHPRVIKSNITQYGRGHDHLKYFEISRDFDLTAPFLWLCRRLTNKNDLELLEETAPDIAGNEVSDIRVQQYDAKTTRPPRRSHPPASPNKIKRRTL